MNKKINLKIQIKEMEEKILPARVAEKVERSHEKVNYIDENFKAKSNAENFAVDKYNLLWKIFKNKMVSRCYYSYFWRN